MEEQAVPAATSQHQPGAVWVQQPQKAQDPALVDQLDVVDVPDGGLGVVRLLLTLCLPYFSQPGQGESEEQKSQGCIQVLQRLGTFQTLGNCSQTNKKKKQKRLNVNHGAIIYRFPFGIIIIINIY